MKMNKVSSQPPCYFLAGSALLTPVSDSHSLAAVEKDGFNLQEVWASLFRMSGPYQGLTSVTDSFSIPEKKTHFVPRMNNLDIQ